MKERAAELKAGKRGKKANGEADLLAKIEAMKGSDKTTARRLHAVVKANAPELSPKTWYGMPAYADENGKVVCFFRAAAMFKERYMTFGFNQEAKLDDGTMWPIAFALTKLTTDDEKKLGALIKKAVG